jgi:ammonium transporter, Amt family
MSNDQQSYALIVHCFQWFLIGYSLSFSVTGSRFIGNFAHIASINVLDGPALGTGVIPDIAFYIFELMFCATAAAGDNCHFLIVVID